MAKYITCKNCGGGFSNELDKCPYCGTMHKAGAYKKFRYKIRDFIDQLLGLKDEAQKSLSKIIFSSILRALLIGMVIISVAFLLSLFRNTNFYNDRRYDQDRLDEITWQNENISKLDEAYEKGDYDTIEKLYYENSVAVYKWKHYASYYLKQEHKQLLSEERISEYVLRDCMYYIYNPDYLVNTNSMSLEEYEEYENMRQDIIDKLVQDGYSESELQNIFDTHRDSYGYLNSSDLKRYLKGENNG